jgi:hypothetical protein
MMDDISDPTSVQVEEPSPPDERLRIASEFLLNSPPGEINDVFNGTFLIP